MMFNSLTAEVFVAEQISIEDIGMAAERGIRTIICNRPDGETPDQPETELLRRAAAEAGIEFVHIPVVSGRFDEQSIEAFQSVLLSGQKPVLAYCRSGMRSSCLWALASVDSMELNGIVSAAKDAGYDLSPLVPALEARNMRSNR